MIDIHNGEGEVRKISIESLGLCALKCTEFRRRDIPDLEIVVLLELERFKDLSDAHVEHRLSVNSRNIPQHTKYQVGEPLSRLPIQKCTIHLQRWLDGQGYESLQFLLSHEII
jgi:hypothetical protein